MVIRMHRIIIAEDDRKLNDGILLSLKEEGLDFLQCYTLREVRITLLKYQADLLILDVNFPDGSGMELLKELRHDGEALKVILLTANNMETDIVTGLELGANDYITKPFGLMELRARVKVQLRSIQESKGSTHFCAGKFDFDFEKMLFRVDGRTIELSKTEQRLLRLLTENRGITIKRERLIDEVWSGDLEYVDGHALTVTVKRLRDKLGDAGEETSCIKTVYGIGYTFTMEGNR